MSDTALPATIAVLDVGKTNIKLSACTDQGAVVETLSHANTTCPGPPWVHHDLAGQAIWLFRALKDLCGRHPLRDINFAGHGVGGVLVAEAAANGDGTAVPMIDYEQEPPAALNDAYIPQAGDFFDRGSAIMQATTHTARQMFWAEVADPEGFARADHVLGIPQYWAWRLSGVAASEVTHLAAQSHLWNVARGAFSPIVGARGWTGLMPPFHHAGDVLGPLRADLCAAHGLPRLRVHTGLHDSSANFYRYQAAGYSNLVVVSTGTWIVGLADGIALADLDEALGMTLNADVGGNPVAGALSMGGREFMAVAGDQPEGAMADMEVVKRLIARGTMALPSFSPADGQFPGSGGRGRIDGPPPETAAERLALAVLYVALLTETCAAALDPDRLLILDGSFVRDPAFATLVAALRPGQRTLVNPEGYGVAAGTALLCRQGQAKAELNLLTPAAAPDIPDLTAWAARWRTLARTQKDEK